MLTTRHIVATLYADDDLKIRGHPDKNYTRTTMVAEFTGSITLSVDLVERHSRRETREARWQNNEKRFMSVALRPRDFF